MSKNDRGLQTGEDFRKANIKLAMEGRKVFSACGLERFTEQFNLVSYSPLILAPASLACHISPKCDFDLESGIYTVQFFSRSKQLMIGAPLVDEGADQNTSRPYVIYADQIKYLEGKGDSPAEAYADCNATLQGLTAETGYLMIQSVFPSHNPVHFSLFHYDGKTSQLTRYGNKDPQSEEIFDLYAVPRNRLWMLGGVPFHPLEPQDLHPMATVQL